MTARVLEVILPLFAIALVGFFYGRVKRPDMTVTNRLNMDLFIPILIFHVLSDRDFAVSEYLNLGIAGALVVLGSGALALPVVWLTRVRAKTFVPPMMFTNSANLGLPLAVFAFGESALAAAMVLFVVGNTLHFTLGIYIMDPRTKLQAVLRMPFIVATIAGLVFSASGLVVPEVIGRAIAMLAQIGIPLMLFALGVRLTEIDLADWRIGALGALLCPAYGLIIAVLFLSFFELPKTQASLLLIFAALPPAVINFIIAETYSQEPAKVASIIMMGHLATVAIMPILLFFILN
jgi:predicted permease